MQRKKVRWQGRQRAPVNNKQNTASSLQIPWTWIHSPASQVDRMLTECPCNLYHSIIWAKSFYWLHRHKWSSFRIRKESNGFVGTIFCQGLTFFTAPNSSRMLPPKPQAIYEFYGLGSANSPFNYLIKVFLLTSSTQIIIFHSLERTEWVCWDKILPRAYFVFTAQN